MLILTELRKCSRCTSTIEIEYFSINREGEHNKTCVNCLDKAKTYKAEEIQCERCGEIRSRGSLSIHKRRYFCMTYNMEKKPEFEDWLMDQDYEKLVWEYKELLKEIIERKRNNDDTKITHSEYLQRVRSLKEEVTN